MYRPSDAEFTILLSFFFSLRMRSLVDLSSFRVVQRRPGGSTVSGTHGFEGLNLLVSVGLSPNPSVFYKNTDICPTHHELKTADCLYRSKRVAVRQHREVTWITGGEIDHSIGATLPNVHATFFRESMSGEGGIMIQ